jgi:hypothetical protein
MSLRALFLGMVLGTLLAAADAAAVARALRQPADEARFPQAATVMLLQEFRATLDARGRTVWDGHMLLKVLQERAVSQVSDQQLPFRGDEESCEILMARTHLPTGKVQTLAPDSIQEVSAPEASAAPFYSKARMKVVHFPGVQVGSVLELKYRITPLPGQKADGGLSPFSGGLDLGGYDPVLERSIQIRVPMGVPLRYECFNGQAPPEVRSVGKSVAYTWVAKNQPQIVQEDGMVPLSELVPRVVWTVVKDHRELGGWLEARFRSAAVPDAAVTEQALALTTGLVTPEAKVERLASFVTRDIRYVPLGLGRVGYQPTRAGTILVNRYADCRDKVVLFQALLEAVGLSAQPVLVHQERVQPSRLPCLGEYQGLLAQVTLPSGVGYFDLGQKYVRLGDLLPSDAGRPALRVGVEGGEVFALPGGNPEDQLAKAHWDLSLEPGGDLKGRLRFEGSGLFDGQIRSGLADLNDDQRRVQFQHLVDRIRKGAILERFEVSDLMDLSQRPVVTLTIRIPDYGCQQGDMRILSLPDDLFPLAYPLVATPHPTMTYPLLVPATGGFEVTLSMNILDGSRIAYLPGSSRVQEGPFAYQAEWAQQSAGFRMTRRSTWIEGVVSPAAYPALWKVRNELGSPGDATVLLEQAK